MDNTDIILINVVTRTVEDTGPYNNGGVYKVCIGVVR